MLTKRRKSAARSSLPLQNGVRSSFFVKLDLTPFFYLVSSVGGW